MIWTNPTAFFAAPLVLVPVLIHLLTRRHAPRRIFPTIRFLPGATSAAMRRRRVDDVLLVAIRTAIVAAGIGAGAGPFLVTTARQRAWNARVERAEIVDADPSAGRIGERFARAVAWLAMQPPGRREIVVRSAFPIGSISSSDLRNVPADIGLRFVREGRLPSSSITAAATALVSDAPPTAVERTAVLDGTKTSVRVGDARSTASMPVEIVASDRAAAAQMVRELLADGVAAPRRGLGARIVLTPNAEGAALRDAWMADAAARIMRDVAEWIARGRRVPPVRFGTADGRLIVSTDTGVSTPFARMLVTSVFSALAPRRELVTQETAAISDAQLRAWQRSPGVARAPVPQAIPLDDRRWVWGLLLALLAVEAIVRRRTRDVNAGGLRIGQSGNEARVA